MVCPFKSHKNLGGQSAQVELPGYFEGDSRDIHVYIYNYSVRVYIYNYSVCMYVCMYVCMCIYIIIYIYGGFLKWGGAPKLLVSILK